MYRPDRIEVVERLRLEGLLPAIVFIFSRAGCQQAVDMLRRSGIVLTDADERERIREYVEMRASVLPDDDLAVLGYEEWREALVCGFAAHHAGLIPLFKETVEELFERALCKVVFATETLALGINMPAKTVVLERLTKFTGEKHEMLTPADYTQLTGRAGRRGMDPVGYGVTLLQTDIPFDRIAALASGRSYPLVSSFRPSYNMAVNLLTRHSVDEAERLLNLSFAQFLADRSVVRQSRQIAKNERFIEGYREHAVCERGDIDGYWALVKQLRRSEREAAERFRTDRARNVRAAFEELRPGQVVLVRRGPRAGLAAVVELRHGKGGEPQPVVLTEDRKLTRLSVRDFREPPTVVGHVRLPKGEPRAPRFRHEVGSQLEGLEPVEAAPVGKRFTPREEDRALRKAIEAHPIFDCPDRIEHERWMERIEGLEAETASLRRRVRAKTGTLARTFERVLGVLRSFHYVDDDVVTERGERLRRIYNESDLLVAEALHTGVFDGLEPPDLAAVVSSLVYETRIGVPQPNYPNERVRRAVGKLERLYRSIHNVEADRQLELVKEPDPGFVGPIHDWVAGAPLEDVLAEAEMSAGDFVRAAKQVWDLLRQLAEVDDGDVGKACRSAAGALYRGVIAYSGAL